ncbi:MAG: rhomboid family intramembrane serine protease [Phycisphaeraceae bacterium]
MAWYERDYNQQGFGGGLGARLSGGSVVIWLLGINCAVFVLDAIFAGGTRTGGTPWLREFGNFNVEQTFLGFQLWRLVTYQFLHAGLLHIFFNMLVLFFFGPLMEQWWGSRRFLVFYLLCGISGAVVMTALSFIPGLLAVSPQTELVGASGSIFGILIGAAVLYPHQRVMLLIPPIPMSLRTLAIVILGIAVLSLLAGTQNAGGQAAHLGGALLGFVLVKRPHWLDWADRGSLRVSLAEMRTRAAKGRWQKLQQKRADEEAEVNRILDKVKNHGLQSLSRREKKTLNRATEQKRRTG